MISNSDYNSGRYGVLKIRIVPSDLVSTFLYPFRLLWHSAQPDAQDARNVKSYSPKKFYSLQFVHGLSLSWDCSPCPALTNCEPGVASLCSNRSFPHVVCPLVKFISDGCSQRSRLLFHLGWIWGSSHKSGIREERQ